MSGKVGTAARGAMVLAAIAIGLEVNVDYLAVCVEDLTGTVRYDAIARLPTA